MKFKILENAATLMYGKRWLDGLSRDLAGTRVKYTGHGLSPRSIKVWRAKDEVPGWVSSSLPMILESAAISAEKTSIAMRAAAKEIASEECA
ncbi:hypothetical protein ACELLULO517_15665 [Acidisoma cellulosilytica]|uniref:Uncharacterized protein n=1 Tax=Acidisoma cellulosilyticum TaxID=2802395 RepID=A0A964E4H0_9PROT|nr:hypothetical protein [Acidisoma cellulosilyticum]MCB8881685.1 hypothetical protein [Acidisoma cellulosilyticum]